MRTDEDILNFVGFNTLNIEDKTYTLQKALGGNSASSFKYKNIIDQNDIVFVKFLISPRNNLELYKFNMESEILKLANKHPVKTTPLLIAKGEHDNFPIYYHVTEWINGKELKVILSKLRPCKSVCVNLLPRIFQASYLETQS